MGSVNIVTRSGERFRNRQEAGRLLAQQLLKYRGRGVVVLGIPRGGVIVARELAHELQADLDVVLSRKLRTPGNPELALGSVSEDGRVFLNQSVVAEFGASEDYIRKEKEFQLAEISRRVQLIRGVLPKVSLQNRIVIVTDDGVATGATTQAAFWAARHEKPQRLIGAMPVGPEDTLTRLAQDTDELICLRSPAFFMAVGQFYEQFQTVEDSEVVAVLKQEQARKSRVGRRSNTDVNHP